MSRHEQPAAPAAVRRDLDAIDRTLAGAAVTGPEAPLAELTRTLRSLRSEPSPEFARALDVRAAAGFAKGPHAGDGPAAAARRWAGLSSLGPALLRSALLRPAAGAVAAALVALAVAVAVWPSGSHRRPVPVPQAGEIPAATEKSATQGASTPGTPAVRPGSSSARNSSARPEAGPSQAGPAAPTEPAAPGSSAGEAAGGPARRIERTSTLDLGVAPDAVRSSSQRVFSVVTSLGGYVRQSSVSATQGSSGETTEDESGASFDIRIPAAKLPAAIASLSHLGRVRSENDTTNDVTGRYDALQGLLRRERAEQASLLKQLAASASGSEAAAVKARLRVVEAHIRHTGGSLQALQGRIDFAPLALSLTPEHHAGGAGGGGLTPGGAADSAAEILQTALAVLLIGLAAALPLGLVALAAWSLLALGRRRLREQALDAS